MSKTITLRLENKDYELFHHLAEGENRAIANFIVTKAKLRLEEEQYTDTFETAEILNNQPLLARLKQGHLEAKKRKGSSEKRDGLD